MHGKKEEVGSRLLKWESITELLLYFNCLCLCDPTSCNICCLKVTLPIPATGGSTKHRKEHKVTNSLKKCKDFNNKDHKEHTANLLTNTRISTARITTDH